MKIALCFVLAFAAATQAITWSNCDANALLKVDSISPADGSLNKQTVLNVRATSTSTYQDGSMTAVVEVVIKKDLWLLGYVTVPDFVYSIGIKSVIEDLVPGVTYLEGKKFKITCEASKKFLKDCPPKQGPIVIPTVDLGPLLTKLSSMVGGSYLGSGDFKVDAKATIEQTNEPLLCLNIGVNVAI